MNNQQEELEIIFKKVEDKYGKEGLNKCIELSKKTVLNIQDSIDILKLYNFDIDKVYKITEHWAKTGSHYSLYNFLSLAIWR